jgi:hypothetical protein
MKAGLAGDVAYRGASLLNRHKRNGGVPVSADFSEKQPISPVEERTRPAGEAWPARFAMFLLVSNEKHAEQEWFEDDAPLCFLFPG